MRTAELLNALSKTEPGLLCLVGPNCSSIETLYKPRVRYEASTLLEAALLVAAEVFTYLDCPPEVKTALDEYEFNTTNSRL